MSAQRHRRSQGEGAVFQRKDGKWRGALDLGWIDGKRVRRWVYGATEREVLVKLAELRDAQRRGQNLSARRYTFGQWLDEWFAAKQSQGTRATTLRGYEWLIRQHIRPALGGIRLDKLMPTDVRHLVERKAESGLSAQSVRLMHALIRNVLADAEREELVHRNVAKLVRPPKARREEVRVLTVEDARRLVHVIRGDRFEALWVCALTLGLRKGELLGLCWSDIDFGNSTSQCDRPCSGSAAAWSLPSRRPRYPAGQCRFRPPHWPHYGHTGPGRMPTGWRLARHGGTADSCSRPTWAVRWNQAT